VAPLRSGFRFEDKTMRYALLALIWLLGSLVSSGPVSAAGGGAVGGGGGYSAEAPSGSSADRAAVRAYDSGRKQIEKAIEYAKEGAAQTDQKKREKLEKKSVERFERAVAELQKAIDRKSDFYEAWSELGFALRSLGRYDEAVSAYDRSLAIRGDYAPAIEYRGEAHLELGRLDEAARAYQRLVMSSSDLAEQLLAKMRQWVDRKRADPGDMDPDVIESFGRWVDKRSAAQLSGAPRSLW
jgi:tetratricopeptide (TPR) repeat protein